MAPDEFYMMQRAYPHFNLAESQAAYLAALQQADNSQNRTTAGFATDWRLEGPGNTGARFNTVAIHPTNPAIMYAGACLGGLFKTTNNGQTWEPIFDDHAYLAMGDIALDPQDPNTLYVGTGDVNINGYVYVGNGLYKSSDAGQTWTHIGLDSQKIISKIIVHPTNSNVMYVGTMGNPFVANNERGLYKTTDGGQTWTQVLFTSTLSGVIDMVMDPQNPNILYAATYDRYRTPYNSIVSGPNSQIWKTTDGGQNWTPINNGIALPCGRIGLAISQQNPQLLYAIVASGDISGVNTSDFRNVYKTTDGGSNWNELSSAVVYQGGFAWYFGKIRVNPTNDEEVWLLGVDITYSTDGGQTWQDGDAFYETHADKHDLQWNNSGRKILATDGGLYGFNGTGGWDDIENMPTNQIYRLGINPHAPGMYAVGVQDNGTNYGNHASLNSWQQYWYGDGFTSRFDPTNSNIWYAMSQYLGLVYSMDGGSNFDDHTNGIDFNEPAHWDAPFILSQNNPNTQYTATERVYKNTSGPGGTWSPISPKLTDAPLVSDRFHTITTVAESYASPQTLWAGTTDANVWVTDNGGGSWNSVHTNGLPDLYITAIHPSFSNAQTAIVTQSGYRANDNTPHIHKTTDLGQTWTPIAGDLPPLAINDVAIYAPNENVMFVATDGGVYGTLDGGMKWEKVGNNLPTVPVFDVEIDMNTKRLLAGTFARSLYSVSLDSILTAVSIQPANLPTASLKLYPNPAQDYLNLSIPAAEVREAKLSIFNTQGRLLRQMPYTERISVADLPKGVYLISVENRNKKWVGNCVKE